MTAYVVAQGNSKRRLKPQNLVIFPWEKERIEGEIKRQLKGRGHEYKETLRTEMEALAAEIWK
jgi:hypothetical protein